MYLYFILQNSFISYKATFRKEERWLVGLPLDLRIIPKIMQPYYSLFPYKTNVLHFAIGIFNVDHYTSSMSNYRNNNKKNSDSKSLQSRGLGYSSGNRPSQVPKLSFNFSKYSPIPLRTFSICVCFRGKALFSFTFLALID